MSNPLLATQQHRSFRADHGAGQRAYTETVFPIEIPEHACMRCHGNMLAKLKHRKTSLGLMVMFY